MVKDQEEILDTAKKPVWRCEKKMTKMKKIVCWMAAFLFAFSAAALLSDPAFVVSATAHTGGYYIWKVENKTYKGYRYGSWKTVDSVVISEEGDILDVTLPASEEYSDVVTGDVKVSRSSLEAAIKEDQDENSEDIRDAMVSSVQVGKENAPVGTYYLKERPVYQCWKIEQQQYERIGGRTIKGGAPAYCYVQKFDYVERSVG